MTERTGDIDGIKIISLVPTGDSTMDDAKRDPHIDSAMGVIIERAREAQAVMKWLIDNGWMDDIGGVDGMGKPPTEDLAALYMLRQPITISNTVSDYAKRTMSIGDAMYIADMLKKDK